MARTPLPAQDGLKFLRVARQFQVQPWADVVRSSDQHPLYPALIALAEPAVSLAIGQGPDAWRLAAQGVSMLAALALLWPLHSLTRCLFDERTANLAVFLYALLPFPAAIGHDTLSDSLALSFTVAALCLGEVTLRTRSWIAAIGCGVAAGLGFLTRPEAALVVPVVVIAAMWGWRSWREEMAVFGRLVALTASILLFVGAYAMVKGELSEKLALRWSTQIGTKAYVARKPPPQLPTGLDNPQFDFSPKEESDQPSLVNMPLEATGRLFREWAEGTTLILIPVILWGLVRTRSLEGSAAGRRMILVYVVGFSLIAIRHASTLGYLSGRHALTPGRRDDPVGLGGNLGVARGVPGASWADPRARAPARLCRPDGPGHRGDRHAGEGGTSQPLGLSRGRDSGWPTGRSRATRCWTPGAGPRSSGAFPAMTTGMSARP